MATFVESVQVVPVKLDNSNYVHWASFMRNFLKGRNLWKYVTGDCKKPIVTSDVSSTKAFDDWEINNSRVITLLASAVSPFISLQDRLAVMDPKFACDNDTLLFQSYIDEFKLVQFLMALRDDFEAVRSSMFYRSPLPFVETALSELLSEGTRGQTGGPLGSSISVTETVLAAAPLRSSSSSAPKSGQSRDMSRVQCKYYKEFGHMKFTSPKLKKSPPTTAAHPRTAASATPAVSSCAKPQISSPLTAIDVQDMITKALSSLGQGTSSASALSAHSGKSSWIIGSGASCHMSSDLSLFVSTSSPASASFSPICTANGSQLSVSSLCGLGFHVLFTSSVCQVQDPTSGKVLGTGRKVGRLFDLEALDTLSRFPLNYSFTASYDSAFTLWHSRLGHVSSRTLLKLISNGHLGSVSSTPLNCVSYKLGKHTVLSFNSSDTRASTPFDLIHSDVWGPAPISTTGGSTYYVVFIDDFSRFVWVYLLQSRSAFYTAYDEFSSMVHTQFSKTIKNFRSDSRGEYVSQKFRALLNSHGTQHQLSCSYTPQQNGIAERKHRHFMETTRALLLSSSVPRVFWGEAVLTSVNIINRLPPPVLNNSTPFASLYGVFPDYLSLRVFGSTCFVLLLERERDKLSARSAMCVFLGYGLQQKGFRCFDPMANKLRISRHVTFWEKIPFFSLPQNKSQSDISPISVFDLFLVLSVPLSFSIEQDAGSLPATPLSPECSLGLELVPHSDSSSPSSSALPLPVDPSSRYPTCVRQPLARLNDYECYFSALCSIHEPTSYREASSYPLWQKAIAEELDALTKTRTWDLVSLPPGKSIVGCKWIFKVKTTADGSIDGYKARLVAKGYTQEYGIDYEETFAPVARSSFDCFSCKEVYMKPPPGYSHLPGQSNHDSALFTRCSSRGIVLLLLYVDDMVITSDDLSGISDLKTYLISYFEMKDLGPLRYFLGLEVLPLSGGYGISQVKYASDLVNRAGLSDNKTSDMPLELNLADPTLYRQLVDGLLYLSITRPDISYVVNVVSQFMAAPRSIHYAAVIRILRYVKGTLMQGLFMSSASPLSLLAFSDADWAGDVIDRRSTTGYLVFLGYSPISWRSKKQSTVSRSSTEVEYRALADTTSEIVWLRWLLQDMGVHLDSSSPLYCDNKSAMQIVHNAVFHDRTKHIEVDCHFIHHHCALGTVDLLYVPSEDQVMICLPSRSLDRVLATYVPNFSCVPLNHLEFEGGCYSM
ncbi:hypothetical protein H6P81_018847 [Aristolochia fimbriata]|uniref:Integrase catalytic domain-containing protein n=1 Tax=Aristolochia fimbriata TaxID=158543 RepID=A0AAV7E343_ARIFI|nr:hypothetical protein H6P81_018847 [Aristolochia fimbriata]